MAARVILEPLGEEFLYDSHCYLRLGVPKWTQEAHAAHQGRLARNARIGSGTDHIACSRAVSVRVVSESGAINGTIR